MKRIVIGCLTTVLGVALGAPGCNSSSSNKSTSPVQICTPNQQTCLGDSTSVVCTSDGLSRIPVQCGTGMKCDSTSGMCVASPNTACTSADNTCMDATTALLCTSNGVQAMACPSNTNCAGPGLCQGSCIVGSSLCLDNNTVATCMDGHTYTSATCGSGKGCVTTGTDPYNTAACMPAACMPDPNGCDFVCGDKTGGSGTPANTMSTCVETPNGFQWVAITCPSPQTCSPSAAACSSGTGNQAACSEECNPGDTRCADENGYQTCGSDGTWGGTVTACNANAGSAEYICFASRTGQGVCGDVACIDENTLAEVASDVGACDAAGKFHACGNDGRVAADGVACTSGTCVVTQSLPGSYQTGQCVTQCNNGDEQCIDSGTYQTCANGLWGAPQECAGGADCQQYTNAAGSPAIVCGDCIPGYHQCDMSNGEIQTCQANATWGADVACTAGSCVTTPPSGDDAACIAQCFPGKPVCGGNPVTVPGVNISATDSSGTCTAQGTLPATFTACASGEYCRTGPTSAGGSPVVYGCVVCVGTQNEYGLPDTRCEDANDTTDESYQSGGYVEQCKADNSAWDMANHVQCTGNNPYCIPASTGIPIAPNSPYCQAEFGLPYVSASELEDNYGVDCSVFGDPANGAPCAAQGGGTISDCCPSFCQPPEQPVPASCSN